MAKSLARAARRQVANNQRTVDQAEKAGTPPGKMIRQPTLDSFQNVISRIGYGTDNQSSYSGYNYNPITNLRILLDFAYRSSWVCRAVVQGRAKDMTRAGIDIESDMEPTDSDRLMRGLTKRVWLPLRRAIQWGRLYGGSGAFIMIDGQKPDTPLQLDRVGRGAFKGLLPLDRWLVEPSLSDLVTDMGSADFGKPKFYKTSADTPLRPNTTIHHTRFIRFEGDDLPYYQSLATMLWGMSVLEPVWDRLLAFDSTTAGIAQLVYRASIRNLYIENWKETVAAGGDRLTAQLQAIDWVRRMQGIEGMTVLDATDRFESLQFTFTGLDSVLLQMAQQLAGATRYPMTILYGQSPVGMNATGESDVRMYYDSILTDQNDVVKPGLDRLIRVEAASNDIKIDNDFNYRFNPLWQLTDEQKAGVAQQNTTTIEGAYSSGLIGRKTALKELKQQSRETGMWTNISEEDIDAAENEPPNMGGMNLGEAPGLEGPPGTSTSPGEPGGPPDFLPNGSFLPNGQDPTDSAGAFEQGELERADRTVKPPLVHIHGGPRGREGMRRVHLKRQPGRMLRLHVNDTDLPGRSTEFAGHRIVVEVEKGQKRTMGSSGGAVMAAPYGYFPGTMGNDDDAVDVFLGPDTNSGKVWVFDQCDPDTGEFHQHKVFLGFNFPEEPLDVFHRFYSDGRASDRLMKATEMDLPTFGEWLGKYKVGSEGMAAYIS